MEENISCEDFTKEGKPVGTTEGLELGIALVGEPVGTLVGEELGLREGVQVGDTVGDVGIALGSAEGTLVGKDVGMIEGTDVGA